MAGTQLRNHDGAAFDRAAYDVIAGFSARTAVLSASLVHPSKGFMVYDQCEADMARAMSDIADQTFMAVDSTKFNEAQTSPVLRLPGLTEKDVLITDRKLPASFRSLPGDAELVIAGVKAQAGSP